MKATLLRTLLCSLLASSSTLAVDGLLGYWRLDEGGGDVATDSSGNGNDGEIIEGTDAWVDDPERGSVYQSGNGSFIDLGEFMPVIDLDEIDNAHPPLSWSSIIKSTFLLDKKTVEILNQKLLEIITHCDTTQCFPPKV